MSNTIHGLHSHNFVSGTGHIIAVWKDGVVHRTNSGSAWFKGPGLTIDADAEVFMTSFLDHVFLTNNTDKMWEFDGSVWTQDNNSIDGLLAAYITSHTARVFLYNIQIGRALPQRHSSRVWFSDLPGNDGFSWGFEEGSDLVTTASSETITSASSLFKSRNIKVGDPLFILSGSDSRVKEYTVQSVDSETQITLTETLTTTATNIVFWVGGNYFDVQTDDGDIGMGFGITANEVFCFKRNTVHRYNVAGQTLRQVQNAVGTTSPRSIVSKNGYVYWYHPTGIYRTTGENAQLISNGIEDIVSGMSTATYDDVFSWVNEQEDTINFFLGSVTTRDGEVINRCVASFEENSEIWSLREFDRDFHCATPWLRSNIPEVYAGGIASDVYQMDTGNDFDGNEISFRFHTKPYFPLGPQAIINFSRLSAFVEDGPNVHIQYKLLYRPLRDGVWYSDTEWKPLKGSQQGSRADWVFPPEERAAGIKFLILESSTNKTFLMEKLVAYFTNPANY